eukprot:gene13371-9199_t
MSIDARQHSQQQPSQPQGGYHGGYNNQQQNGGGYRRRDDGANRGYGHQTDNGGYGGGYQRGGRGFGRGRGNSNFGQQHYFNPNEPLSGNTYHREEKPEEDVFKDHNPGINFDQYETVEVSLTPNDVEPAESFLAMNLAPALKENVNRCRYSKPTPVQKYGIPVVLKGRDLMACAQTGSGKTAAYLIPAINYMLVNNCSRRGDDSNMTRYPSALVLAPTRELSIQISEEGRKFTYRSGIRSVVVYGGADPRHQIAEMGRGCGLLVATPGRLLDLFNRGYVGFAKIQFLVLDEADRMLDMGFEPQIRQIVIESDMPPPGQRQTLLYSATFPKEIQQLAREFLHHHSFLQVGRVGSTTANITQEIRWVEDRNKLQMLLDILNEYQNKHVLVFVEKKRDADTLERHINRAGHTVTSIHGDRGQRDREQALGSFKSGLCNILVATDVASRGLDIPNVALVIQYDLPSNIDDYVHRIGRTGRAGKQGTAIAFFNDKNRNVVDDLIPLLKETNQVVIPQIQMLAKQPNPNPPNRGRRGAGGRGGGYGGYGNSWGRGGGRGGNREFFGTRHGDPQAFVPRDGTGRGGRGSAFGAPMNNRQYRYSGSVGGYGDQALGKDMLNPRCGEPFSPHYNRYEYSKKPSVDEKLTTSIYRSERNCDPIGGFTRSKLMRSSRHIGEFCLLIASTPKLVPLPGRHYRKTSTNYNSRELCRFLQTVEDFRTLECICSAIIITASTPPLRTNLVVSSCLDSWDSFYTSYAVPHVRMQMDVLSVRPERTVYGMRRGRGLKTNLTIHRRGPKLLMVLYKKRQTLKDEGDRICSPCSLKDCTTVEAFKLCMDDRARCWRINQKKKEEFISVDFCIYQWMRFLCLDVSTSGLYVCVLLRLLLLFITGSLARYGAIPPEWILRLILANALHRQSLKGLVPFNIERLLASVP